MTTSNDYMPNLNNNFSEELTKKRLGAAIGILPSLPVGFDDPKLDEEIANDFNL